MDEQRSELLPRPIMTSLVSVVLPANNKASSLQRLLPAIKKCYPDSEILVINDGSTNGTVAICRENEIKVISHRYSIGNGASIKHGAPAANGRVIVFMDADGQHDPVDIPQLLAKLDEGYDMVIGAQQSDSQASLWRDFANRLYNRMASWMTGHKIADLTSGFRAVRAEKFREFLYLLPNGFSYPTTITMAFFRSGYQITYLPIHAHRRQGKTHINPLSW